MLDINLIKNDKNAVEKALLKRLSAKDFDLDKIIKLDAQRREIIGQVEALKAERNQLSKTKPDKKTIDKLKKTGEKIKTLDSKLAKYEEELNQEMAKLPNLPAEDVLPGEKENNKVIRSFGKKPKFKYNLRDHVELATGLGLIDYDRAVKMSGTGFWIYTGDGAVLEWALLNYFIEFHRKNNYKFILPPYLLTEQSAYTSGHLPKFRDDLFWTQDKLCLNATSEMMLGNLHRDELLSADLLPLKYFAYSTCFRREAGGYRAEERGMIRGHQFNKIEMFAFTKPGDSWTAFEELLTNAEELIKGLDLHFNTVQLAAGDSSAAMAKTIDLEVWIPSMQIYKEVSSVSNATDYQARRGNIRYKDDKSGRNEFVHTLNASGLATSRLIPAILEQYQQEDGSVEVPKVLQKFVGKKVLKVDA